MFIIFKDFNIKTKSENNKPPTTGGGIQNLFNINIFLVRQVSLSFFTRHLPKKVVQYSTENYPLTYLNGLLANLQEGHFNGRKRTLR